MSAESLVCRHPVSPKPTNERQDWTEENSRRPSLNMGWENMDDDDLAGPSHTIRQPSDAIVDRAGSHLSPHTQGSSALAPDLTAAFSSSMSLSCVTRQTSQDDCSYSRFLAWAAVQRNLCWRISSSEKLSCPLYQCGKQFKDHETMLKHLAACQYLATREYWCYDHKRVERFDVAKCKRCISHPSRRKKMLSMTKSFFSSLGHKSKKSPELDFDIDETRILAPPSYHESLNYDPPAKSELFSTEILEIDSTEVPVPQVSLTEAPIPVINPQALLLPELDSTMIPMQSGMQWQPTTYLPTPTNTQFFTAAPAYESLSATRPASQGPLQGAQQNRQAPRSKNLSPSSSVRSTTSTASNVSNVSSITTTSSLWSAPSTAWSGFETNLTTLSRDESFNDVTEQCPSDPLYVLPEIPELPADMPTVPELSSGDFDSFQDLLFSFDANLDSTNVSYPENLGLDEEAVVPPVVHPMRTGGSAICQSEVQSLVAIAWEALQEHIISSTNKIQHVHNPLADQLRLFSPQTIAFRGLGCLRRLLDGSPPISALDTLCLVHVVYSFSLVVYADDIVYGDGATRRSREFFAQSMLYATWFAPEDQVFFRQVAKAIWQPGDIADNQLSRLLREQSIPLQRSPSNKGKEHATRLNGTNDDKNDPLISAAQNFLDGRFNVFGLRLGPCNCGRERLRREADIRSLELEVSAILGSSVDNLATGLRAKHSEDASIGGNADVQVTLKGQGLRNVLSVLVNRFHEVDGLVAQLSQVNNRLSSGLVCSTRRFELEALQAGQVINSSPRTQVFPSLN